MSEREEMRRLFPASVGVKLASPTPTTAKDDCPIHGVPWISPDICPVCDELERQAPTTDRVELVEQWQKARVGAEADDDEAAYQMGLRDGIEGAVQHFDRLTGGDGEYCYSLGFKSERHCPDPPAMLSRIKGRIQSDAATIAGMREAIEAYCKAYDGVTGTIHVNKLMRAALKGGDHG